MKNPEKGFTRTRKNFVLQNLRGRGFTLIEILIVVAILMLLLMFVFINLRGQSARATDIKRKTDLYTLRKSFEDYNNDHGTFPVQSAVNTCGDTNMAPYIANIPCDPVSKIHYGYFPAANGGYRICTKLSDTTDPAIAAMGCTGPLGCGTGGPPSGGVYNYCLASGVTASAIGTTPPPIPGGVDTPGYNFACARADYLGISYCKSYLNPLTQWHCPTSYPDSNCNNECQSNPAVRCP
jgi:prepilin-type N-terminal cleavage/methylation domain-containing protein